MAYLSLGAACLLFSMQFLFSKGYQLRAKNGFRSALWMATLDGAYFFLLFFPLNGFQIQMTASSALYGAIFSFSALACNVASYFAMERGKVAVVTLFTLSGGLLLPLLYGVICLKERMGPGRWAGALLVLLSFFPGALWGDRTVEKQAAPLPKQAVFWLLCILVFMSNGVGAVAAKAHAVSAQSVPERDFLLFAALLRLGAGSLFLAGQKLNRRRADSSVETKQRDCLWLVLLVGGFTLCNGIGNLFSLSAARSLAASLQFPLLSGVVVALSALFSRGIYKEKLSPGDLLGLAMTGAGVTLMIVCG